MNMLFVIGLAVVILIGIRCITEQLTYDTLNAELDELVDDEYDVVVVMYTIYS